MSYPPNLPQEIQGKIMLLSEYQKQIESLELQLQKTKTQHDQLQAELLQYRDAGHTFSNKSAIGTNVSLATCVAATINKLPTEMFLYIFEYFLSKNHRRIRTLLMVCKHWNRIVMQYPKLWARIQLSPISFIDYLDSRTSSTVYIEACLQHSQSLLLDIQLDCDAFTSSEDCIREQVEYAVRGIADESEGDRIFEWSFNLDCDFPSAQHEEYSEYILVEIDTLVGLEGIHMERWQNLDLCLPFSRGFEIWTKFIGRTPNLQRVNFSQLDTTMDYISLGDEFGEQFESSFPELPNLRSLKVDDLGARNLLSYRNFSSSPLQHVDVLCPVSSLGLLDVLSHFPLLWELSLRTYAREDTVEPNKTHPSYVLRLLNLEQLTLWGNSHILSDVEFEFPNLKGLRICSGNRFYFHPSPSPTHIHWSVSTPTTGLDDGDDDDRSSPESVASALRTLLHLYSRIQVLTIQEFAREYIPQILSELKKSSSLPESLKTVVVELSDGRRELIHVS